MYKALEDIGDFKKGEIVPDDLGSIWMEMYKVSPIEKIEHENVVKEVKVTEKLEESTINPMLNDYLNRNVNVVRNNLKEDAIDKKTLEDLLVLEKSEKNRYKVITLIKLKLEEVDKIDK